MPPEKVEIRPTGEEKTELLKDLSPVLTDAHLAKKGTVLRRLNRSEYENTMNDIFGTRLKVAHLLPEDGRSHEFDNVGKALGISMTHLQSYLEAARLVIRTATSKQHEQPKPVFTIGSFSEEKMKEFEGKSWEVLPDGAVARYHGDSYPFGLYENTDVKVPGFYEIEISAYAYQTETPVVCSIASFSWKGPNEGDVYHYATFPPGKPTTVKLRRWMDPGDKVKIEPQGLFVPWPRPDPLSSYEGPGLAVRSVTTNGPFLDEFPTAGFELIFGAMERKLIEPPDPAHKDTAWYQPEYETVTGDENATAVAAIRRVAEKAWRRPVEDAELTQYLDLFKEERLANTGFDDSLYHAITALFISPNFLYFRESEGELDSHQIANRLSYFLTRSSPDQELRDLADKGDLSGNLVPQAERLMAGPNFERFIRDFTDAWLDLREMEDTSPDAKLFPTYDHHLHVSLPAETKAFVTDLIRSNLPVRNIVKSDYAMLNDRLAKHYDLPPVGNTEIRKVKIPADSVRGGLITQGSILKVTANGTNTSPVMRGVWILERILGTPPQPPPAGIPGIEPDIRGAETLRQILEKHRDSESCAACHQKIDPPGFALESFDPVGGFRERFRTTADGEKVEGNVLGKRIEYKLGLPVDCSGELPDGRKFSTFVEFRDMLAGEQEQLARAFATKLLTFATGREMGFSDLPEIERIVSSTAKGGYGAEDILKAAVASEIFLTK